MSNLSNEEIKILLFDVSPFLYMSYFAATGILNNQADLSNESKVARISCSILESKLQTCFSFFANENILPVFCYDGINSIIKKKEVNPQYKEGRSHPLTKNIRKEMLDILKLFPGYHISNDDEEADDLISTMKFKLKDKYPEANFCIFSKDNDLLQLCDYRTTFFDPGTNKGFRGREYLSEKFNGLINFKHIILHKICFGDSSDNIEGVFKGKRRKPIIDVIQTCSCLKQFLEEAPFENEDQKRRAIELFSIIRLKTNCSYSGFLISDTAQLDFDVKLVKDDELLN